MKSKFGKPIGLVEINKNILDLKILENNNFK
jgi:hypothetical protein